MSEFDGYVPLDEKGRVVIGEGTRRDKARGAAEGFEKDYESMRTTYNTYRRDSDPKDVKLSDRLERADESAGRALRRAGREADAEELRESRRTVMEPTATDARGRRTAAHDPRVGRNAGEVGQPWNLRFNK